MLVYTGCEQRTDEDFLFQTLWRDHFDSFRLGESTTLTQNFQKLSVDPNLHFFTGKPFLLRKQNPLKIKTLAVPVLVFIK